MSKNHIYAYLQEDRRIKCSDVYVSNVCTYICMYLDVKGKNLYMKSTEKSKLTKFNDAEHSLIIFLEHQIHFKSQRGLCPGKINPLFIAFIFLQDTITITML
jgi:hypothetical protein